MPSYANLAALSAALLQVLPALAAPAAGGAGPDAWAEDKFWGGSSHGDTANINIDGDYSYSHGDPEGGYGGSDNHCGHHGYHSPPPFTMTDCPVWPTATVTVTIDGDGTGSATITEIITACTATVTTGNNNIAGSTTTETETETVVSTISSCTATTTDLTTVTEDGPTVTSTITTPGPVSTTTEYIGTSTVTEPGVTETETVTDTITSTDTSTITNNQVVTEVSTVTSTDTKTLEITTTVTADDCSNTGDSGGGGLDYGTCTDPTIKWVYGLDGRTDYSYTTNNQKDFTFGSSPTIDAPADLVCNRLRSPCNAPQATIDQCYAAESAVAGLSGQAAADTWNEMMT